MTGLLSPFPLRGLTFKNRMVVSPMCQYSARAGVWWGTITWSTLADLPLAGFPP